MAATRSRRPPELVIHIAGYLDQDCLGFTTMFVALPIDIDASEKFPFSFPYTDSASLLATD